MRLFRRIALITATATTLIACAFSANALANRLSLNANTLREVWNPIRLTSAELEVPVECSVTLEATFHSATIRKVVGALIGNYTRAVVAHPCAGGEMWIHNGTENPLGRGAPATSLPWHITYEGFTGTLPQITSIRQLITGMRVTIAAGGGLCLGTYGSSTENFIDIVTVNNTGTLTAVEPEASATLRRSEGGAFCPATVTFQNRSSVTQLGSTAALVLRLI